MSDKKEKVKIISDVLRMLLLSFVNGLDRFLIERIPVIDVKIGVKMLLSPVRKMIDALNDLEPENEAQVREVWRKFANEDLTDYSEATIQKLISGIKNEHLRPALAHLTVPTVEMLRIVTDNDKDDQRQLQELFDQFVNSADTHDVVLDHLLAPFLYGTIKNPELVEYILQTIADLLRMENPEKAARLDAVIVQFRAAA